MAVKFQAQHFLQDLAIHKSCGTGMENIGRVWQGRGRRHVQLHWDSIVLTSHHSIETTQTNLERECRDHHTCIMPTING